MAAPVDLNMVYVRLGFNVEAAAILADPQRENLELSSLHLFNDKEVKVLCATLRKPGGTVAAAAGGAVVPNPGVYVTTRAEMNLTAACYMARHYARTTRTLTPADLTVERVQRYAQYRQAEEAYKEPDEVMKLIKPEKIIDFIDEWPDHLALYDGQGGRPLSYVIRPTPLIPVENFDPTFGEPQLRYPSLRDEIVTRAAHVEPHFNIDNARVYELLNEAVTEHKHVKTWIAPYARTRDGRGAWFAFKAHYRGSSELEAIETTAEHRLDNLVYRGEKPRYNFETHVSMHRKSHLELEKATGQLIPGQTKVRRLLKSLQVPNMAIPVATIRAQDVLRLDFDAAVNYLRSFLASSDPETRTVASAETKKRPGNIKKGGGFAKKPKKSRDSSGDKALDRYYTSQEWWKLDKDVRDKIIAMRKKRQISDVSQVKHEEDHHNDSDDEDAPTSQRKAGKKSPKRS
jgi:hypothetical protein